jgi:hypothetical protein
LIDQGTDEFRRIEDAQRKLEALASLATGGRHVKITMDWQIEEETKGIRDSG